MSRKVSMTASAEAIASTTYAYVSDVRQVAVCLNTVSGSICV